MAQHARRPNTRTGAAGARVTVVRAARFAVRWLIAMALVATAHAPAMGAETIAISAPQLRVEFTLAGEREAAFREALQRLASAEHLRLMQGTTVQLTGAASTWILTGTGLTLDLAPQLNTASTGDGRPMLALLFCDPCSLWTGEDSPVLALLGEYSTSPIRVQHDTQLTAEASQGGL